jgi:hypothetical protein
MRSPAASPVVMDVFLFIRLTAYERGLDEYWVTPIFYFWIYFTFAGTVWHAGCLMFPMAAEFLLDEAKGRRKILCITYVGATLFRRSRVLA